MTSVFSREYSLQLFKSELTQKDRNSLGQFLPAPGVEKYCLEKSTSYIISNNSFRENDLVVQLCLELLIKINEDLAVLHWLVSSIKLVESGLVWCPAWTGLTFCQGASDTLRKVKTLSWQVIMIWKLNLGHEQQNGGLTPGGKGDRI